MDKQIKHKIIAWYIAGGKLMFFGAGVIAVYMYLISTGAIIREPVKWVVLLGGLAVAFLGYRIICLAGEKHCEMLDKKIAEQTARAQELEAVRSNREGLFVALAMRLGLSEKQTGDMVHSMRVQVTSPEDVAAGVDPKVSAAAKQALHVIRWLSRHRDMTAGEIIFSVMMLWLDESVIPEDDPLLDEVTNAWAALAGKQRAGLALKAGCSSCGDEFKPGDLLELNGKDTYRHKDCPARCTSTTVAQMPNVTGMSTEFRCTHDMMHFGDHGCGSVTWARKPEEDQAERDAYAAEFAAAPKEELTEREQLEREFARETAVLDQLKEDLQRAKQRTSLYDHEQELVEYQQEEVNFLREQLEELDKEQQQTAGGAL